jgi:TolB protein
MADFYRTPAVGTTRIYVRVDEALNFNSYMQALKRGRSFVTNGPLLEFRAGGGQPGDVIQRTKGEVAFTLDLHTAVPVDSLYVLVNGEVAWRGKGLESPGSVRAQGSVKVPAGGWIAAVASGGTTTHWPAMDSYAYAHTAPLWIGKSASVDPAAAAQAARDLLLALDVAEARVNAAYAGADVPKLRAHFQKARRTLEERIPR